jgi:hypothetical protein
MHREWGSIPLSLRALWRQIRIHMPIQIINPLDYPDWDSLLGTNEHASFFHTSNWARVLYESYNYTPLYFCSIENGTLSALLPVMEVKSVLTGKRGVSLPFTDFCHPIATDQGQYQTIFDHILDYGKHAGWKYIELRNGANTLPNARPSLTYYTHTLELTPNEQDLLKSFRSSTKRNIKKAEKEGVTVEIHKSFNSIKEFYRLNCITRKHHGLPPQPFYFFKKIYEHVISKKKGFVSVASYLNHVIACAVYFHFSDTAIYKYGASDRTYQHLRANNLVMWEAITSLARNGFRSLNLGRTEPQNTGLLQFKRGWHVKETTINYVRFNLLTNAFEKRSSIPASTHKIFSALPSPVLNLAGRLLYRHVG